MRTITDGTVADEIMRFTGVDLELIADGAHYRRIVQEVVAQARHSVWMATATLKDTRIQQDFWQYQSIVSLLGELAKRGCDVRILHGSEPSRAFQDSLRHQCPAIQLRSNERVHCKIVLVDGYQLYLGSANVTGAGLGAKADHRRNHELGIFTRSLDVARMVRQYFESVWNHSGQHP